MLRPRCALRAGVTSKERRVTMRACRMKGHRGSGHGRGGWSRVGGGWEADGSGSVPSAQQKGDSRWPQGPPPPQPQPHPTPHINSIQGDALSSRQRDTFLTTSEPPHPLGPPSLPLLLARALITLWWGCRINHRGTYSLTLKSRVEPIAVQPLPLTPLRGKNGI